MSKIKDEIKKLVFSIDRRKETTRVEKDVAENEWISEESLKRQSEFSAPRHPEIINIKKKKRDA